MKPKKAAGIRQALAKVKRPQALRCIPLWSCPTPKTQHATKTVNAENHWFALRSGRARQTKAASPRRTIAKAKKGICATMGAGCYPGRLNIITA